MNLLSRGIQGYAVIVGGIAVLAVVLGANRYLFKLTTAETGWPLLVGAAIVIVTLIAGLRRLVASAADFGVYDRPADPYHWGNQPSQSDGGGGGR